MKPWPSRREGLAGSVRTAPKAAIVTVCAGSPEYPPLLRECPSWPPPVLYRAGAPLDRALGPCPVAMAGTRDPTPEGRRLARGLGRELARRGHAVVTGLARGVDEEAALGALEAGGRVVAVLPYLIERDGTPSPRAAWLLRAAARRGALASAVAENLAGDEGRVREWLAARNRIVACMAVALVVPEARFRHAHWGTRYAVEHATMARRLVVVLVPRARDSSVVRAFEHLRGRGAAAARDIDGALSAAAFSCRKRYK